MIEDPLQVGLNSQLDIQKLNQYTTRKKVGYKSIGKDLPKALVWERVEGCGNQLYDPSIWKKHAYLLSQTHLSVKKQIRLDIGKIIVRQLYIR